MQDDSLIPRYLDRYGAPEASRLDDFPERFRRAVVIPAFAEPVSSLLRLHEPPLSLPGILTILVINAPESAQPDEIQTNRRYSEALESRYPAVWKRGNMRLYRTVANAAVLAIGRFEEGARLPRRAAVGLARRIGCDCAARLWHAGQLDSDWIQTTDADAYLPTSCFEADCANAVAVTYPFTHRKPDDAGLALAACLYELSMHYYVLGLRWAGSPYAMHTVGSTLAVRAGAYARVRGFPKRAGGEDFYLLNKLAKIGCIRCLHQPSVRLETRLSSRVPFGTGPAVSRIRSLSRPLERYLFYEPRIFRFLRAWLRTIPVLYENPRDPARLTGEMCEDSRPDPGLISAWMDAFDVTGAVTHARRHGLSRLQFVRQMHVWFDAFRTLKTVHFLRDHGLPSRPAREMLSAPFVPCSPSASPEDALEALRNDCWKTTVETGVSQ